MEKSDWLIQKKISELEINHVIVIHTHLMKINCVLAPVVFVHLCRSVFKKEEGKFRKRKPLSKVTFFGP